MKKALTVILVVALIAALVILTPMAFAAPEKITLSAGDSLTTALNRIANGGTIVVDGTVAVTAAPGVHGKTVTITGGTLDFTGLSGDICLGDHITFDDITLDFADNAAVFACGYQVKIGEGVTMTNPIRIFGGKRGTPVASTHLTLLAGTYYQAFGGGNNGDVIGDTYLYVGGNVNSAINAASHEHTYCVYGGGFIHENYTANIGGTAYMVFDGNAKANYVYGGNQGAGTGSIKGGSNVTVSGGTCVGVYGGGRDSAQNGDVTLLISGGKIEQVLGGCENNNMTGDVKLDITGGTITRRVYGGCYNNYDSGWQSSYAVNGNVVLTLHSGANITFDYSGSDLAIYAHSRQKNPSAEVSHLVYADSTAYNTYRNKVKAQDFAMSVIMSGVSAADRVHYHTYTASGAVLTQNCTDGNCSATATVEIEGKPIYGGAPVEPAKVTYSGDWYGDALEITYANNNAVGTATASVTCGGATASCSFSISEPDLTMGGKGYETLEDAIAAARQTPEADVITIEKDMSLSSGLVIDTDVTITAQKAVTITAADSQTGSMIRIASGNVTVAGASEAAKITLAAGKNTDHVISNNGGNVALTNVQLTGSKSSTSQKACGIFSYEGTMIAKSVTITDMVKGDGIQVLKGAEVTVDNVTISGSGRYGIKVQGSLTIGNSVNSDHALTVSDCAKHGIDVEDGGKVVCDFQNVSADAELIKLFGNEGKGLNVREGGDAELSYVSEES